MTFRGKKDMGTLVVKVKQLKLEFKSGLQDHHDFRGHLEAVMASGATKMVVIGNMHMDVGVIGKL